MNRTRTLTLTACTLTALALAGCTSQATANVADKAPAVSLDPLTCYIDGTDSVDTPSVTLQCGGGTEAKIDLAGTRPGADRQTPLADWTVTKVSTGVSDLGSSIVRVHTTDGERTCTYYRNMAYTPEETTTDCKS